MNLKEGDKFITYYGNVYTFLELYPENFDSDFVAKDDEGKLRNFTWDMVKEKIEVL